MATTTQDTRNSTSPRWSAGKILLLVFGSILSLIALALLAAGAFVLWANATQRDSSGYFTTPTEWFSPGSYAVTHEAVELFDRPWEGDLGFAPGDLATVRIRVTGPEGKPIFVGIAPAADVSAFLRGVEHAEIEHLSYDPFEVDYLRREGGAATGPPGEQTFWVASAGGSDTQTLTWPLEEGTWSAVIMNADASDGVAANVELGAKVKFLGWVALGLLVGGGTLLGGGAMIYFGWRNPR